MIRFVALGVLVVAGVLLAVFFGEISSAITDVLAAALGRG